MFMVRDILRLDLVVNSVLKPLNRVEKIPNLVVVNSNPRVSLFTWIVTRFYWCENVCCK